MFPKNGTTAFLLLAIIFLHFPPFARLSTTAFVKIKDPTVRIKKQQKSVISVGDHMYTSYYVDLEELKKAVRNDRTLSKEEKLRRYNALSENYFIAPDEDGGTNKIKAIQSADGKRQFTVSFVGSTNVIKKFASADKNGLNTMRDLAGMLDEIYREDSSERSVLLKEKNLKIRPHEYMVNDGKDIYSIKVGRQTGTKDWKTRFLGAPERPKPAKISKDRGNVRVQGWEDEAMRSHLKETFDRGRRKYFGRFGKRKREKIPFEMAKAEVAAAFERQSRHLFSPNPVSASFSGINAKKRTEDSERIVHLDEREMARINSMPDKSTEEIVTNYIKMG